MKKILVGAAAFGCISGPSWAGKTEIPAKAGGARRAGGTRKTVGGTRTTGGKARKTTGGARGRAVAGKAVATSKAAAGRAAAARPPKLPKAVVGAVRAAYDRKALDVVVLDLRKAEGFTDYFVICTGTNMRQIHAIADAVTNALRNDLGERPALAEGTHTSEWILLDYFNFVVHVFSRDCRAFYSLERLWGNAERYECADPGGEGAGTPFEVTR